MLGPELLPLGLAILAVCAANYTDLKRRIIPNELTLPLIAVGLAFYALLGAYQRDVWVAASGALGASLAFAIGYAIWLAGGWAGGDVKLFTALGALLPKYEPPYSQAPYPFALTLLFNAVIAVAPVLLLYIAVSCARKPGIGGEIISPLRASAFRFVEAPFVIVGCSALGLEIASSLSLNWQLGWLSAALLIVVAYRLPSRARVPIAVALTGYGLYLAPLTAAKAFVFILLALPGLRLLISAVNVANREVLQEEVKIAELEEGMIPAEVIYEKDGKVGRYSPSYWELLRGSVRKPKWDRVLADPRVAAGLTRGQVRALRRLAREGKLRGSVRVKKGMPFAPALGLGLLISVFYGDVYWRLVLALAGVPAGL